MQDSGKAKSDLEDRSEEATSDETLKDIEDTEAISDTSSSTDDADIPSPDGQFDENRREPPDVRPT